MGWEEQMAGLATAIRGGQPGGATQLAFYEAGLIDDPGFWTQRIEVYWDERLNPDSPEYDHDFASEVARESPSPEEAREMEAERGWS